MPEWQILATETSCSSNVVESPERDGQTAVSEAANQNFLDNGGFHGEPPHLKDTKHKSQVRPLLSSSKKNNERRCIVDIPGRRRRFLRLGAPSFGRLVPTLARRGLPTTALEPAEFRRGPLCLYLAILSLVGGVLMILNLVNVV